MAPPTNCLAPIGAEQILTGLLKGVKAEFFTATTRPPAVYRGNPFQIEVGLAYGGDLGPDPKEEDEEQKVEAVVKRGKIVAPDRNVTQARVIRFANRVPLLYQQSACSSFKAVSETNWKNYALQQPKGSLPVGPLVVMIHMASVWVPFTSESKEAIADYDEIREEMELALKECGRKLKTYLNKRDRMKAAGERRSIFLRYIGEIAKAVSEINGENAKALYDALMKTAQRKTLEMDQTLDEEGKVVDATEKLEADESVYVKPLDEQDLIAIAEAREQRAETATVSKPTGRTRTKKSATASTIGRDESAMQAPKPASPQAPSQTNLFGESVATPSKKKVVLVRKKVTKKKS